MAAATEHLLLRPSRKGHSWQSTRASCCQRRSIGGDTHLEWCAEAKLGWTCHNPFSSIASQSFSSLHRPTWLCVPLRGCREGGAAATVLQSDYCIRIDDEWTIDGAERATDTTTFSACHMNHAAGAASNVARLTFRRQQSVRFYAKRDIQVRHSPAEAYSDISHVSIKMLCLPHLSTHESSVMLQSRIAAMLDN